MRPASRPLLVDSGRTSPDHKTSTSRPDRCALTPNHLGALGEPLRASRPALSDISPPSTSQKKGGYDLHVPREARGHSPAYQSTLPPFTSRGRRHHPFGGHRAYNRSKVAAPHAPPKTLKDILSAPHELITVASSRPPAGSTCMVYTPPLYGGDFGRISPSIAPRVSTRCTALLTVSQGDDRVFCRARRIRGLTLSPLQQ